MIPAPSSATRQAAIAADARRARQRRLLLAIAYLLLYLAVWSRVVWAGPAPGQELRLDGCAASLYFSPRGGAEAAMVAEIGAARDSIHVLAYSFTSQPIITALRQAQKRGVVVEIVLDKGQDSPRYAALRQGLPVRVDRRHAIAHNKVMIFDRRAVAFGSFNFTRAAEQSNAENLRIEHCPVTAARFLADWDKHHAHSEPPRSTRVDVRIGGGR